MIQPRAQGPRPKRRTTDQGHRTTDSQFSTRPNRSAVLIRLIGERTFPMPRRHCVLHQVGFASRDIARAIEPFRGATRRHKSFSRMTVSVDDYTSPYRDSGDAEAFKALRPRRLRCLHLIATLARNMCRRSSRPLSPRRISSG
jgi:hypothetical protein